MLNPLFNPQTRARRAPWLMVWDNNGSIVNKNVAYFHLVGTKAIRAHHNYNLNTAVLSSLEDYFYRIPLIHVNF